MANKTITISHSLIYYDVPQLMIAQDVVDTKYLCLLEAQAFDKYTCITISNERLSELQTGSIDLLEVFKKPETGGWFSAHDIDENSLELSSLEEVDPDNLPDSGFYLPAPSDVNPTLSLEVNEYQNAVVHLSLSDQFNSNSIEFGTLGEIAYLYQGLLKNSFKKVMKSQILPDKQSFLVQDNYALRAFAVSEGSFRIHLHSKSTSDLFGRFIIENALELIDQLTTDYQNEDELIDLFKLSKGHTLSSLRNFLKKLSDKNISLNYDWLTPTRKEVVRNNLPVEYSRRILDILNQKNELIEERVFLTGIFKKADVEIGNWRLLNEEDAKEYSGKAAGPLLEGVTLETKRYKLECLETIEESRITEKETLTYMLESLNEE